MSKQQPPQASTESQVCTVSQRGLQEVEILRDDGQSDHTAAEEVVEVRPLKKIKVELEQSGPSTLEEGGGALSMPQVQLARHQVEDVGASEQLAKVELPTGGFKE